MVRRVGNFRNVNVDRNGGGFLGRRRFSLTDGVGSMPQPLVIRQAGEFERTTFLVSIFLGVIAVFTPLEVSTALEETWPAGSNWLFGIMALGGLGGAWVTRGLDGFRLSKSMRDIRSECIAECYALTVISLSWGGYALTALSVSGGRAIAAAAITLGVPLASLWRMATIYVDLRRVRKALSGPRAIQFEALANPEGE